MSADAIIIGAGHNGLACALHLASRGWKVLVLESSDTPGGAVKTAQVTLPGFRHDLYAMNLSLFAGSAFHAEHGATLARHGLAFIAAARPFASAFAEGSSPAWLGLEQGLEATLARIGRVSARDAQAWRALDARFEREAPHLFALLGAPLPSSQAAPPPSRMGRSLGLAGMADSARLLLSSPRDWLSDTFESEAVRCLLAAWGLHLDFAPDVAGGALFPYLEAMAPQRFGMALGQGGADVIVRAMVAALRAAGGELRTGARVRRIHVAGGRAQSVELDDGQRIEARRAVIANVHPGALYGALLAAAAPPDSAQARDPPPRPRDDDDPLGAGRPAGVAREHGTANLRLRPPGALAATNGAGLHAGNGRAAAARAGAGGRPAHRVRPLARASGQACAVGAGAGAAGQAMRRRRRPDGGGALGRHQRRLCRACARHPRTLRPRPARLGAGPLRAVASRPGARQPQSGRRGQPLGQPSPGPGLPSPRRLRPLALAHRRRGLVPHLREHLAGRRNRRGLGLPAGARLVGLSRVGLSRVGMDPPDGRHRPTPFPGLVQGFSAALAVTGREATGAAESMLHGAAQRIHPPCSRAVGGVGLCGGRIPKPRYPALRTGAPGKTGEDETKRASVRPPAALRRCHLRRPSCHIPSGNSICGRYRARPCRAMGCAASIGMGRFVALPPER